MYSPVNGQVRRSPPARQAPNQNPPGQQLARRQSQESERSRKYTAILIILLCMFLTGMVAGLLSYLSTPVILENLKLSSKSKPQLVTYASYSITVLYLLFYPLFGFLADVRLGRYRAIVISVCLMILAMLLTAIEIPIFKSVGPSRVVMVMTIISYVVGVVGMAGFEANIVQFGLDQLMDSTSWSLSLYLHLLVWTRQIGVTLSILPLSLLSCDEQSGFKFDGAFRFMPLATFSLLGVPSIVVLIRKRRCFSQELGNINPYKMVIRVIRYALKNRHPQRRRSAFFYYYGLNPGRLDFAKIHYGGPYSTEDVENVKTLLQMLGMLFCVGPVFILKVSTSYFMYQHFVEHFVDRSFIEEHCHAFWPVMGSGNLQNILTVFLFPLYILLIFTVLKGIPRILLRLFIGIVMLVLCQVCLLVIEVTGHLMMMNSPERSNKTIQCALAFSKLSHNSTFDSDNSLGVPWASLIPLNVLLGLAIPIIMSAVFEFISAQSPRQMTGLLFGTFFFIEGLFQLFGILVLIPFSFGKLWNKKETFDVGSTDSVFLYDTYENSSSHSAAEFASAACEIWYLVVIIACGVVGTVMYSVAMWKYRYRKREEDPFPQSDIEDIITREIEEDTTRNLLDVASVEVRGGATERRNNRALYSAST